MFRKGSQTLVSGGPWMSVELRIGNRSAICCMLLWKKPVLSVYLDITCGKMTSITSDCLMMSPFEYCDFNSASYQWRPAAPWHRDPMKTSHVAIRHSFARQKLRCNAKFLQNQLSCSFLLSLLLLKYNRMRFEESFCQNNKLLFNKLYSRPISLIAV